MRLLLSIIASAFLLGSSHGFAPPRFRRQSVSLASSSPVSSNNREISRRVALVSAAILSLGVASYPAEATIDLERAARQLELANMFKKNSDGAPEKHIPQVSIADSGILTITVNHVMDPVKPHYILMIWLHDVKRNEIAVVKGFPPAGPSPPSLKVQVPTGVELRPMTYCNIHGLWEGDAFTVSSEGSLEFV